MVKLVNMFIPVGHTYTRPGIKMKPTSITIHETDNENSGANALAHARLQVNGNRRQASWHVQVDDKPIAYVSVPFNEVAYHAGNRQGNDSSIAIEICVNRDGDYKKAVQNAAYVVQLIMNKHPHIKKSDIKQHYNWSKKNCPRKLRRGSPLSWSNFLNMIDSSKTKTATKPLNQTYSAGDYVLLKQTAQTYATGERIPSKYKNKQYTIQQVKANRVLLKELYSWVKKSDVNLIKSKKTSAKKNWKVGQKVKIKGTAKKYSRSTVNIPQQYKEKTYTIQQVGLEDILIKELYSWVKKKDINLV